MSSYFSLIKLCVCGKMPETYTFGLDMQFNLPSFDPWVIDALAGFPDQVQERILLKMIDAEQMKSDAFAELRSAERLLSMGFSVIEGNGKEGVFKAKHGKEEPIWVVSCSLSRYMTRGSYLSEDEFLDAVAFAKRRAIKSCFGKIPDNEPAMICLHISPELFGENPDEIDQHLFRQEGRYPIVAGKVSKRLTGLLVAYGEPQEESRNWVFHRPHSVN